MCTVVAKLAYALVVEIGSIYVWLKVFDIVMKSIVLSQFRCFENFEIEFKRGLNVLVGDNANGKTSVLRACKFALSTFFVGFSDENTRLQTPGVMILEGG